MTTSRIREKISAIVSSQLPEFVQSDFPTFVAFIEAYYRFLEQDQSALELVQNARSYNDIDRTTNSFVEYFLKTYANQIPENALLNKRLLVKRINDLYESKGSELSFDLLFRLLYNADVEVKYPFDFVLRASDGRWDQRVSIRVRTLTGNRNEIRNRLVTYTFSGVTYTTPIVSTKNLTANLTEVFLDRNLIAPNYIVGDTINIFDGSDTLIFSGVIEPTLTSFRVLRSGSGFKVGLIYTLSSGSGVDTLIKISKVSSTGGIQEIKFIIYGYGFDINDDPLLLDFDPSKNVSEISDVFTDLTGGFSTSLEIYDTFQDYFLEDYVLAGYMLGNLLSSANTTNAYTPTSTTTKPAEIATLSFSFGALGRYPGQFTAENGFLSEPDVRLQDSLLYQPFAYQTNTEIDRETFFDVVKGLIHPAGQNLFNNRLLSANLDLSANLSLGAVSNVFFEATDSFEITELISLSLSKFEEDIEVPNDSNISKLLSTQFFNEALLNDSDSIEFEKVNLDLLNVTESILLELENELEDTTAIVDEPFLSAAVLLETDVISVNEQISVTYIQQNYADPDYFSELYVGETIVVV